MLQTFLLAMPVAMLTAKSYMYAESYATWWCTKSSRVLRPLIHFSIIMQMYVMLENWQQLTPETAMELLDYQYADVKVRDFAVDCLEVLK